MQILGINQPTAAEKAAANSGYAPWKPWQLFPEGFDQMPLPQKITELYMGQRGFLFWCVGGAGMRAWALPTVWTKGVAGCQPSPAFCNVRAQGEQGRLRFRNWTAGGVGHLPVCWP